MAADFDRNINQVTGPDLLADNVYRVNAADRDRGKAGHDQFRDTLRKKKQNRPGDQPDQPNQEESPAPPPAPPPTDQVLLSSTPPAPVPAPAPPPPAAPEDTDRTEPPPTGHIHVTA